MSDEEHGLGWPIKNHDNPHPAGFMNHESKLENARKAINELFGDMSVPRSKTRESLEELASQITILLDTLDD